MYLKKIHIENVGPIEKLISKDEKGNNIDGIEMPFHTEGEKNGLPKPLILVGQNGSGKSTVLSFIVNAFFEMKRSAYKRQDEIEASSTFRTRSGYQIKSGTKYYWSKLTFDDSDFVAEFETTLLENELTEELKEKKKDAGKGYNHSFVNKKDLYAKGVFLYFPPNRSEDPIWLHANVLNLEAKFKDPELFFDKTDRKIIQKSPLKEVKNWLLDLLLDEYGLKDQKASELRISVTSLMKDFLGKSAPVRLGFGERKQRQIQVVDLASDSMICPDLFAMSSGEVSLFCMFCSILRDADLASIDLEIDKEDKEGKTGIKGIIVIDEIDLHLHTKMQSEILPKLIALFPKIQFIITTHSPLFLLGMEDQFTKDGIEIIELENGKSKRLSASINYSEFVESANLMKLRWDLENSKVPLVLVEGPTDVKYIEKAAQLLEKSDLLQKVKLKIVGSVNKKSGSTKDSNNEALERAKRFLESNLETLVDKRVLIIYDPEDCGRGNGDFETGNFVNGNLLVRKIELPNNTDNLPVQKGIEALFSKELLDQLTKSHPNLIEKYNEDSEYKISKKIIGAKMSVCDWICTNTTTSEEDFANFDQIFKMIEEVLQTPLQDSQNNQNSNS